MSEDFRHFLVIRDHDEKLVRVYMYDDERIDEALSEYSRLEWLRYDCCLFGADSLVTLMKTHPDWFPPRYRAIVERGPEHEYEEDERDLSEMYQPDWYPEWLGPNNG